PPSINPSVPGGRTIQNGFDSPLGAAVAFVHSESVSGPRSAQPAPEPTGSLPELHPYLEQAFGALERAGVRWALVRGDDQLADPVGCVHALVACPRLARVGRAWG